MAGISNSSPLIVFARAERFGVLRAVFEELYIAPAVWFEVVERGFGRPGVDTLANANWITVLNPPKTETVDQLLQLLDRGEAETIALAMELPQRLPVLIDDGPGRRVATGLGIEIIGSGGVLIRAKNAGFISDVRPVLEELRLAGLYLGEPVVRSILRMANED